MPKEVVRSLLWAGCCGLLFVALGFLPLLFSSGSSWSASRVSATAMPVGESSPSSVAGPLKIAKMPTVYGDPALHP